MCVKNKRYWDGEGGGLVKNCPNIILRMKFNKLIVLIYGKLDMMSVCMYKWVDGCTYSSSIQPNKYQHIFFYTIQRGLA